jgi:hypothetical protein
MHIGFWLPVVRESESLTLVWALRLKRAPIAVCGLLSIMCLVMTDHLIGWSNGPLFNLRMITVFFV